MDNPNIEIVKEGNNLKFYDHETNCKVTYNTSNSLLYDLADFSCGNRGKGQGLKLLYYSLKYIKTQIPRPPFRIELLVAPSSTDETINDFNKLKNYYKQIGFKEDDYAKNLGLENKMYAFTDTLVVDIKNKLDQTAGYLKRKTKRKSYRNKKNKKTIKKINYKPVKKNNRL